MRASKVVGLMIRYKVTIPAKRLMPMSTRTEIMIFFVCFVIFLSAHKKRRAGDGNRTHAESLGSSRSTIELHPRVVRKGARYFSVSGHESPSFLYGWIVNHLYNITIWIRTIKTTRAISMVFRWRMNSHRLCSKISMPLIDCFR